MPLLTWLLPIALADDPLPPTMVYVVRHAEKADSPDNPDLTPAGQDRATRLAHMLQNADIKAVFTTDLCRTAQTGDRLAGAQGLPLSVAALDGDATSLDRCTPGLKAPVAAFDGSADLTARLAARIRTQHKGQAVLVVGHGNTLPELVTTLGGPSLCPDPFPLSVRGTCEIPEQEVDDIFVLTLAPPAPVQMIRLRY